MAKDSKIAWTDHTFNVVWGCHKISPGCKNCYADALSARYGQDIWGLGAPRRTFGEKHWNEPKKWNRDAAEAGVRRRVFSSSMGDNFEDHPTVEAEVQKLWPLIKATPSLDWLLLTKRSERISTMLPKNWGPAGYDNVWLGVSLETRAYEGRLDDLRAIPAAVRFVSYEPALGSIAGVDLTGINWLICGGESGPNHRAMQESWALEARDLCRSQGVAFFFKQHSAQRPGHEPTLERVEHHEMPGSGTRNQLRD